MPRLQIGKDRAPRIADRQPGKRIDGRLQIRLDRKRAQQADELAHLRLQRPALARQEPTGDFVVGDIILQPILDGLECVAEKLGQGRSDEGSHLGVGVQGCVEDGLVDPHAPSKHIESRGCYSVGSDE